MATIAETVMQAILARLMGSPALEAEVRRSHRIPVTRDAAPAVHVVDGRDVPTPARNDCRTDRTKGFTVSVYVRDDAGASAADALVQAINERLDPIDAAQTPYPSGAVLRQLSIIPSEEIADGDAVQIDMEFEFDYATSGWRLDA